MRLTYEVLSHVGLVRKINQDMAMVMQQTVRDDSDRFAFEMPDDDFRGGAIVCDGLGGHARGEEASERICHSFRDFIDRIPGGCDDNDLVMLVKQWFRDANEDLIRYGGGELVCTTLSGLLICGDTLLILNCGDSRTYRRRFGRFRRLTIDHSERERTGRSDVPASTIYNCLGLQDAFLDVRLEGIGAGDTYLICSDGLTSMLTDDEIARHLDDSAGLMRQALEADGTDNITFITLTFSE